CPTMRRRSRSSSSTATAIGWDPPDSSAGPSPTPSEGHAMPKRYSCLATRETVRAALRMLRAADCKVDLDEEAGAVTVHDGDAIVYQAIEKGRGQPWIVCCSDSDHIKWVH